MPTISSSKENKATKEIRMNKVANKNNFVHFNLINGFIEDEAGVTGVVGMILNFGVYDDPYDCNEQSFSYDNGVVKRYYEIANHYCVMSEEGNLTITPLVIGNYDHKPTIAIIKLIEEEIDRMFSFRKHY